MTSLIVLLTLTIILTLFLERYNVSLKIKKFNHRILVNGTRGKSSVVKYIYAALNNKSTFAKITGVIPTIYLPNGREEIIKRRGGARVQEQIKMINYANKVEAKNVVLECMSINPQLQQLESKIFKPNIYVITNINNDHAEQMGKSIEEQAKSICNAIPSNSLVFTAEKKHIELINSIAQRRNSKVIFVEEIDNFNLPDGIHPINIAIVKKVCEYIGIDCKDISKLIINKFANEDSVNIKLNNNNIFINSFAVNDVDTAQKLIEDIKFKNPANIKIIVIFNSRNDRPMRSVEFSKWIAEESNIHNVIVIGNHAKRVKKEIRAIRDDKNFIIDDNGILKNFDRYCTRNEIDNSIIIGIGNIAGDGFRILQKLKEENFN
jgi:poly-gamma-glutamate synthase PgsB/CapB